MSNIVEPRGAANGSGIQARLGNSGVRRMTGWIGRLGYGVYAMTMFAVLLPGAALCAFIAPGLERRRQLTGLFARAWLLLAGFKVRVSGLESLPLCNCVLVANHSSYLDGIVLTAVLPPRFSFVIKREAASLPIIGLVLKRIGSEFVDRTSTHRDARRVVQRAEQGLSLVFFPEGTFDAQVGVKRFKLGAFVAASRGNAAVAPTAIRGARRALSSGHLVPRPGRIEVEVLSPIGAHGETPEQLRDEARRLIVERVGEPDLGVQAED
jgi:1-acyl-sn-glycerol-3-phosphate acyltransferase